MLPAAVDENNYRDPKPDVMHTDKNPPSQSSGNPMEEETEGVGKIVLVRLSQPHSKAPLTIIHDGLLHNKGIHFTVLCEMRKAWIKVKESTYEHIT